MYICVIWQPNKTTVSTQDRRMGRNCQTRGLPSSCGSHFLAALPSSDGPGDLQRSAVPPAGSAWLSQTCHPKGAAKWGQSAMLSQWGLSLPLLNFQVKLKNIVYLDSEVMRNLLSRVSAASRLGQTLTGSWAIVSGYDCVTEQDVFTLKCFYL